MKHVLLLAAGFLLGGALYGQTVTGFVRVDTIPVYDNSVQLENPWAGGINSTQFSDIDLDMDGVNDLFVFDRSGNKVTTYLNVGTPGNADYRLAPQYVSRFPLMHDWAILRDYNCDGKMDIFTCSIAGFSIYKNISTLATGLQFQLMQFLVNTDRSPNSTHFIGNLFVSQIDVPAIRDIDGDGDLDILTFSNGGNQVEYHINKSMELYGVCDSIKYVVGTNCWGEFAEDVSNAIINMNATCPAVPVHQTDDAYSSYHMSAHSGSCLECINVDGDNDQDLVIGDISSPELAFLRNGGTNTYAQITQVDQNFPSYDTPVNIDVYNCGFHLDLNNDGLKDLIVCPNAMNTSENFNSVLYYKNTGTNSNASFTFMQDDFLQETMLDFGEGANPVFFDYDNDGDQDLLIGNYGYYSPTPPYHSMIALLKNTGSATNPVYTLMTRDFAGIYASGAGLLYLAPTFGDLDGDGDKDMLVGDYAGKLHFFRKDPGPADNFVLAQMNYLSIDIGNFASPQLVDVDRDGLIDLLIGEQGGNVNYYHNTGTPTAPVFTLSDATFGNIIVNQIGYSTGYSMPCMYDDNNHYVLLVGSERGYVYRFDNIDGNLTGNFTLTDSMYVSALEGGRIGIAVADLNGDGLRDAALGNYAGGLSLFWGDLNVSTGQQFVSSASAFSLYPNPANDNITISINRPLNGNYHAVIHDLRGQIVMEENFNEPLHRIDISTLPAGVYFCALTGPGGFSANNRFIITR